MKKSITQLIKTRLLILATLFLVTLSLKAQVSVTATSGTTGPTSYLNVNAAFAAINSGTHQGAITITVTANTTEPSVATQLLSSGTGSSLYQSILIIPSGNVIINSAIAPTASRGILEFIGADNITIDGDDPLTAGTRNLTVQMAVTSNANTACLRFSSATATGNGCKMVTVKNTNIIGGRNSATTTTSSYGIFSGQNGAANTITTAVSAANNDSMLIENNYFTRAAYGVYSYGASAYPANYFRVIKNTFGSSIAADNIGLRGIFSAYSQTSMGANSALFEGNDIQLGESLTGISTNIAGIELAAGNAGAIVRNNNIHNIDNPNGGVWASIGIYQSSGTSSNDIKIYNNIIRDITNRHNGAFLTLYTNHGIYINGAVTGLVLNHNTIALLKPNIGTGGQYSACVTFNNSSTVVAEMRNNIFVNKQSDNSGQMCLGVYLSSVANISAGIVNRNDYYTSGISGFVGSTSGTNRTTLIDWKNATGKDSNSINFDPPFVSTTDLHLQGSSAGSAFESAGDTLTIITDIDGDARPGPVGSIRGGGYAADIGADEADMSLPGLAVGATGSFSNVTMSSVTLNGAVISDGGGVISATGIVVAAFPNPTRGSFGVTDSTTNPLVASGSFVINFTGLNLGTTYYYRTYIVNSAGTSYSADSIFTTNFSAVAPTLSTTSATNVLAFTATAGGNISSDGGATITANGIVYSTTPAPTLFGLGVVDSTSNPVVTSGNFSIDLGGLTHSTKYYFRAYATNSAGTGYGLTDSFVTAPVISTLPYFQNFDTVVSHGWTTQAINGGITEWALGTPSKTFMNAAFSTPSAWVTNLTGSYSSVSTSDGVLVSPQIDLTSHTISPILRFKHKFDTDADPDWDGGVVEMSINGGAWTRLDNATGTGMNFNTANSVNWYNNSTNSGTLGSNKFNGKSTSYTSNVNGWITSATPLTGAAGQSNVKVRFRFWADVFNVDEGWEIDDIEIVPATAPTMLTGTKTNITSSNATLAGTIISNGGDVITASGIVFSTSLGPTRGGFGVVDSASNPHVANGSFTVNVTGLLNATTYYYRAYAVNGVGTSYGSDSTFTTNASATAPLLTKTSPTNVQAFSASTGGNISSDGGSPITASGIVYATTPNPSLLGFGVVDSANNPVVTNGSFTKVLGGLTHSTKYYYRAYATNAVGTTYSLQDSFTTALAISSLPYFQNFDTTLNHGWSTQALNTGITEWALGTPSKTFMNAAFSAPKAWVTNLNGNYSGVSDNDGVLISPQMDFTTQTATPVLQFKHKFDTDADPDYDGGAVEISINGGAWTRLDNATGTGGNFNTLLSTSWYNNASGNGLLGSNKFNGKSTAYSSHNNGWIVSSTPLTGAAGQSNVKVRFHFGSDAFLVDEGWEIDDIGVFAPSAPITVTGTSANITTSTVTLGGNITSNGGNNVTASGIVYSTSPNPTRGSFGVVDSATNPLIGNGAFTVNVAGLFPATTYYYRSYAVNSLGTSYGADSIFTTNASAVAPSVSTVAASALGTTTATVAGNITSDGGSAVTASGVVFSTSPNPVLFGFGVVDSTTNPVVVSGSFSLPIGNLAHSTKYYFAAYATNSVGTSYGAMDSFTTSPVISNLPYFQNFDTTQNSGWTTTAINGGITEWALGTPAKTFINSAFSGTKAWVTNLTGTYSNVFTNDGVLVSPQMDFTSQTADPVLRFRHKLDTDFDIDWDGGVVEISINNGAWTRLDNSTGTGANFNTPTSTAWYNNSSTSGTLGSNKFNGITTAYSSNTNGWIRSSTPLTGAAGQSNVKVRFRFWSDATNVDEGWAIDDIELFAPAAPNLITGTTTNPTPTTITLSGNITNDGGSVITASGIVYSSSPAPTRGGFGVADSSTNPLVTSGTYTINIGNLNPGTGYYYRAYAVNGVGTSYGADSFFTTPFSAVPPSVTNGSVSNILTTAATLGGNITSDGGATVTASGVVYSTSPNPTLFGFGVVDSTTNPVVTSGAFSKNIAGLTHSTKYYFRSYATNSAGTGYGANDSFTTGLIISSLPYNQDFEASAGSWNTSIVTLTVNNWVLGTPAKTYLTGAHSGTKAWATKLSGDYDVWQDAALESPQFDFTTITSDPVVRFYHKFSSEENWDGMIMEMSINGGAWNRLDNNVGTGTNFNTLRSYAWYNDNVDNSTVGGIIPAPYFSFDAANVAKHSSNVSGWIQSAAKLVGAAGQANVKFRFRFMADGFVTSEGWAIDDIEVVEINQPTIGSSNVVITPGNTTASVSVTKGNGQRRLIVARLTTATAVAPYDSVLYTANTAFSSGSTTGTGNYVVYSDTGSAVTVTGLTQLTNYTFDVYEYNGKYMHNKFTTAISNNTTTTPVKLLNFTGVNQRGDGLLIWSTASEINNKGFEIERSTDGRTFGYVNFVSGSGNSNTIKRYQFSDVNVFNATGASKIYYRLKQVDRDGKYEYSNVISINESNTERFAASAYPVPFSKEVTLNVASTTDGKASIMVVDVQGRVVAERTADVVNGSNNFILNEMDEVNSGVYFVKVIISNESRIVRLVKVN